MVVAENNTGNIYFYHNKKSYRKVTTKCFGITSVLFDNNNQMIVACLDSNIYNYNVNGTDTGLQVTACDSNYKWFVNFDSKDRLVVICDKWIEIYY